MGKHIADLSSDKSHEKGCVTKHQTDFKLGDRCSYRGNGYTEMKNSHSDLYHLDFTTAEHGQRLPAVYNEYKIGTKKIAANLLTATNPREKKAAWWFTTTGNYLSGFLPFNHNHHHILPYVALKQLSYGELQLIQSAAYNLNAGNNMIILPCLDAYGVALRLPSHPHEHSVYNKAVKQIVQEIKNDASEQAEGHAVTEENVGDFKSKLESWQKRQFKELVDYGQNVVAKQNPKKPESNQVNKSPIATAIAPK